MPLSLPAGATRHSGEMPQEIVYQPRQWKQWRAAILCLAIAVLAGLALAKEFALWTHGGAAPSPKSMLVALAVAVCFGFAILLLVCIARGLPRLIVNGVGIRLEAALGARAAAWDSLSAFAITTTEIGRLRRRIMWATADVIGPAVDARLRRQKKLMIPDSFAVPLRQLADQLNAYRVGALGAAYAPRVPTATRAEEGNFGVAGYRAPWLTFGIIAVLAAVFAAEQMFAIGPVGRLLRPSVPTLVALGGLSRATVLAGGEWYRLFTAPLLHADLNHLVFNGIALLLIGYTLERLVGRVWLLAMFVIGALGGGLCSLALNPGNLVSVGASGGIMGLFAAGFIGSFRLPVGTWARGRVQMRSLQMLIPSLLPLAASATSGRIDYAAHLGGVLSCAAVALAMLRTWHDTARLPRLQGAAGAVLVLALLAVGAGAVSIAGRYDNYRGAGGLIPTTLLPKSNDEAKMRASALVHRFPQDPRAHLYYAVWWLDHKEYSRAEPELRTGLQQAEDLQFVLGARLAATMRGLLAAVLADEGREAEAKDTARALCHVAAPDAALQKLLKALERQHLCG